MSNFSKIIDKENDVVQILTELELTDKIGIGIFADIYRIKKDNKFVVKLIRENYCKNLDVLTEIVILNNFKSPNIIKSYGVTVINNKIGLLLSLATGTLESYKFSSLREKELAISSIINGIKWLHSNRWLHLDLKPANILFKESKFFISDFSLSVRTYNLLISLDKHSISPIYRPYENLKGSKIYSDKSDLWSLGLIIYGILNDKYFDDDIMNVSIGGSFNIEMSVIIHIEKLIAWNLWPLSLDDNNNLWNQYSNYLELDCNKRISLISIPYKNTIQNEVIKLFQAIILKYPNMDSEDGYNFSYIIILSLYGRSSDYVGINCNTKLGFYLNNTLNILNSIDFVFE